MPTSQLFVDLSGVARLADVQRPVATMWRSRFAAGDDPFPQAVKVKSGRPLFDAISVAQWLTRTHHGNNPDAVADAAASAAPTDFDLADPNDVATVDALLALRAATGIPVGGENAGDLQRRAWRIDPDDVCLATEAGAAPAGWADWADVLADAAYSPGAASRLIARRHESTRSARGSLGPLSDQCDNLLLVLAAALSTHTAPDVLVVDGMTATFAIDLHTRINSPADLVATSDIDRRTLSRRLLSEGGSIAESATDLTGSRLQILRLPTRATESMAALASLNDVALEIGPNDQAVVLSSAAILTERLEASAAKARAEVLRTGLVRAIIKLPAGFISTSPRETLAIWVLSRPAELVPIAERSTAVADLTDVEISAAAQGDLVSDVLAATGSMRDMRAHAFRFARTVRTTSLSASSGGLVTNARRVQSRASSAADVPARLDRAIDALGEDAPELIPLAFPSPTIEPATVERLIADRHLRVLPGTRITDNEYTEIGLAVVHAAELDDPAAMEARHVDRLAFAAQHTAAQLTEPGDIIFRTSPTPKAWVDRDGAKVVAYPARILRINPADPGGLVPELIVDDIAKVRGGAGAWRRWALRRVAPQTARSLRNALAEIDSRRAALLHRLAALTVYSDLLSTGIVAGAVTLPDLAVPAASDSQQ